MCILVGCPHALADQATGSLANCFSNFHLLPLKLGNRFVLENLLQSVLSPLRKIRDSNGSQSISLSSLSLSWSVSQRNLLFLAFLPVSYKGEHSNHNTKNTAEAEDDNEKNNDHRHPINFVFQTVITRIPLFNFVACRASVKKN